MLLFRDHVWIVKLWLSLLHCFYIVKCPHDGVLVCIEQSSFCGVLVVQSFTHLDEIARAAETNKRMCLATDLDRPVESDLVDRCIITSIKRFRNCWSSLEGINQLVACCPLSRLLFKLL